MSGSFHGSDAFIKKPSDRTITGVIYFVASLTASIDIQKQSEADSGAKTIKCESDGLPNKDMARSPCSVLFGIPVDIPALNKLTISKGTTVNTAKIITELLQKMLK